MAICTAWEFWRTAEGKRSQAEKEWAGLTDRARADFGNLLDQVMAGNRPVDGKVCVKLEGDVFYLRIKHGSNPYRLYYKIRPDQVLIVLNVIYKNQQKLPRQEKALVLKRAKQGNAV